jgi:Polyketide cyclase / dehydrase and lipid transport
MDLTTSDPTAVATAEFAVPASVVWSFRLDFANLPDYNPDVAEVTRTTDGSGVGGPLGPGARYQFAMADPRHPGQSHPVELWIVEAEQDALVTAGMQGGSEAYEEFAIVPNDSDGGCTATLTLWVSAPEGLPADTVAAIGEHGRRQIEMELALMQEVLHRDDTLD